MTGIFDSGLGGLTALNVLHRLAPKEDIVYLGDTARVPYGTRSAETIKKYACECGRFLTDLGVDRLLVACGTVSANALDVITESFDIPVTGVIYPAVRRAAELTKNGRIAVLATGATVKSRAYEKEILRTNPELKVFQRACPLFVPLVENGLDSDSDIVRLTCEMYLRDVREAGTDVIILGCTHYPLISKAITECIPGAVAVSSGEEAARDVAQCIRDSESGIIRYYVTDDSEGFTANAATFLGEPLAGAVFTAEL